MGAISFLTFSKGKTAKEAFDAATARAHYEFGHSGYTGTIAEKGTFSMVEVPTGENPESFASNLLDDDDPRFTDKWGPAGCVMIEPGEYLFFGWASY